METNCLLQARILCVCTVPKAIVIRDGIEFGSVRAELILSSSLSLSSAIRAMPSLIVI